MTWSEVARLLGDSPRSVQYWLKRFEEDGLAGLSEKERSGRPSSLTEKQLAVVDKVLREAPVVHGLSGNLWDGKTLSAFIEKRFRISLGVRQCQRLFRQLGSGFASLVPQSRMLTPNCRSSTKKTESPES